MGSPAPRCPLAALRSPLPAFLGIILLATISVAAQAPPPGAVLDPAPFRYVRDIAPGDAALVDLVLDAAVLAHSKGPRASFADLRIVDPESRQVQYLLMPSVLPLLSVPFKAAPQVPPELASTPGHNRSTYVVELPLAGLPDASLLISSKAETFTRQVQVWVERPADRRHRDRWADLLRQVQWSGGFDQPLLLSLHGAPADAAQINLTVDEGDNAPLPISGVQLMLPGWRARFFRPADVSLRLTYGNREAAVPVYDIGLMRAALIDDQAIEITAGPERAQKEPAAIVSPRVFWGFLIAAVVVLVGLIARLAISRPSEDQPPPSAPRP